MGTFAQEDCCKFCLQVQEHLCWFNLVVLEQMITDLALNRWTNDEPVEGVSMECLLLPTSSSFKSQQKAGSTKRHPVLQLFINWSQSWCYYRFNRRAWTAVLGMFRVGNRWLNLYKNLSLMQWYFFGLPPLFKSGKGFEIQRVESTWPSWMGLGWVRFRYTRKQKIILKSEKLISNLKTEK